MAAEGAVKSFVGPRCLALTRASLRISGVGVRFAILIAATCGNIWFWTSSRFHFPDVAPRYWRDKSGGEGKTMIFNSSDYVQYLKLLQVGCRYYTVLPGHLKVPTMNVSGDRASQGLGVIRKLFEQRRRGPADETKVKALPVPVQQPAWDRCSAQSVQQRGIQARGRATYLDQVA